MTEEQKVAVFQPLLDKFETDEMRLYCTDMIKTIPDYIFEIPSSTSRKHHNKTQCELHGQIYHIIMFAEILNYRLELKHNKERFNVPSQRDAMRCVPIFHDALKCGWEDGQYTVHEHPMLAGTWVRETKVEHDVSDKVKEAIARMCERHSGEFTTSNKSKIVLPEPENAMEFMIHECDVLSSRHNIDMDIPEYLQDIFEDQEVEFDENFTLTFGKYKGMTLMDIYNTDSDYLNWLESTVSRRDVLKMIKAMRKMLETKE